MNKVTVIIALVSLFLAFVLYVLIIVLKNRKKKQIMSSIDRLTTEKNLIISASLITELSKASKLVNNKKIEKEIEEWNKRFKSIEEEDLPKLTDTLIEVENYCMKNDYNNAYKYLNKAEKSVFHVKAKAINLFIFSNCNSILLDTS